MSLHEPSLARAIETGDLTELPGRRDEAWRWTDLRGLLRAMPRPSPANDVMVGPGPFAATAAERVDIINGHGPGSIVVPSGETREVALRFVADRHAGCHTAKLTIEVGADSSLVLLESYEGEGVHYAVHHDLAIRLAEGARLERVVIANDAQSGIAVSLADVVLSAGTTFCQTVLTTGAKRQRLETRVAHPGAGASVRLDGAYLLTGQDHADITTIVAHDGPGGETDQMIKGVVADQARGVFQGRIIVRHGADQTTARMKHDALVLSDRAEVDSKPELEIYADDVSCAHGNTVGALDEEAMFYAAQRGIPEEAARAMLTRAFVETVVDRIDHEAAREVARQWVARQLGVES